jgi:hypothetical protein
LPLERLGHDSGGVSVGLPSDKAFVQRPGLGARPDLGHLVLPDPVVARGQQARDLVDIFSCQREAWMIAGGQRPLNIEGAMLRHDLVRRPSPRIDCWQPAKLVGLFTRLAALVMSGEMAFAYFMAHAPKSIYPAVNGGSLPVLYCFVFLYLVFAGGGPWSIDRAVLKQD